VVCRILGDSMAQAGPVAKFAILIRKIVVPKMGTMGYLMVR
jgi:hypothetical protein